MAESLPCNHQDPLWVLVLHVLAFPLPVQLHACAWKATEDRPSPWDSVPVWRTWKKHLASDWFSSTIVATWEVNQRTKDLSLFLPLCIWISNKK